MMAKTSTYFRIIALLLSFTLLTACNLLNNGGGGGGDDEENTSDESSTNINAKTSKVGDMPELRFAAARYLPWLPWFLADDEKLFDVYSEEYNVNIKFIGDLSYDATLSKFIARDIEAVVATNIDTLAKISTSGLETDVIIISSYSVGNDALLVSPETESIMSGQSVALKNLSSSHYLLDRYLLRHQIGADEVSIVDTSEGDLAATLASNRVSGIATWNPVVGQLLSERKAKVLFSTQEVPKEIFHVLVVHRETLADNPNFARALLAIWFSIMERLQGHNKGATLDSLAALNGLEREEFDRRWSTIELTDTPTRALSTLRDRRNHKKTMRHVRFFMGRHDIAAEVDVSNWVSYPGRTPNLLHFNARPLQNFVTPAEGTGETEN